VEGDTWLKMIRVKAVKYTKKILPFFRFGYKKKMGKYDKNEVEKNKILETEHSKF